MPPASRLTAIADCLGHRFQDVDLLLQALTHASACDSQAQASERLAASNERMEFLGDALLGAAIAEALYKRFPDANEGICSQAKSRLVSRKTLAQAMDRHELCQYCIVGEQMGQQWPISVKANLAEGLLGAIYLDGGWLPLCSAVGRLLGQDLADLRDAPRMDHKNQLQIHCLEHFKDLPAYASERTGGSDHNPEFTATVRIGRHQATGSDSSRRRAETKAAEALLQLLEQLPDARAEG